MSNISFKDFLLRSGLSADDCIVGYDSQTGDEIRIKASNLVQKGDQGESVQIQFSTNAQSWHFPAMETDMYIRFRAGSGAWSTAIRIGVPETNNCTPELIQVAATEKILEPEANTYYKFGTLTNLELQNIPDSILPIVIWFVSSYVTKTNLVLPSDVLIPTSGVEINENKIYELTIINKKMVIVEFNNPL